MDNDFAFRENAAASFREIEECGLAAAPLPFEQATIGQAERVDSAVYNPVTGEVKKTKNIIYERHPDGRLPERAYWVRRIIRECIFGVVKSCIVLKFRNTHDALWEVTKQEAVVKIMAWQRIRDLRHVEDPVKEVAAMQHVSRDGVHPNVMGAMDILKDEEYLLLFMPRCKPGELHDMVGQAGRFSEAMARYWFKQLLEGLTHLQKMGVCHRDLSLENILVDQYRTLVIIDLGMVLRVPFARDGGGVTDVSGGNLRRLITPVAHGGKLKYVSPEALDGRNDFDGFAIDLWSAGVILFYMLVGKPPWYVARHDDPRYRKVISGNLGRMLQVWKREVSAGATDLLQRMLQEDPRHRLSLAEVKNHGWVRDTNVETHRPPAQEGWRG